MNHAKIAEHVIDFIASRTYMSAEKKLSDNFHVRQVIPEDVAKCAASLEATAVMIDTAPGDTPVTVNTTRDELTAFVCYMRQLDTDYRELTRQYQSCAGELEKAMVRIDEQHKEVEKAQADRAATCPPPARARGADLRTIEDEFAELSAGNLSFLEKTALVQRIALRFKK